LRPARPLAPELDGLVETSETPESKAFAAVLEREGVRAALAWRRQTR
jgi:hypothetical protein